MAECEFIGANFAETRRLIAELLARGKSKIDRAAVYRLKMHLHMVESALPEAIQSGLDCLQMFDVVLPVKPTPQDLEIEYNQVWLNLGVRPIESLIDLPSMTNSEMETAMSVLSILSRAAYLVDSNLTYLIVCRMVNISLTHGTTDGSAQGFAWFALYLGPVFPSLSRWRSFCRARYPIYREASIVGLDLRYLPTRADGSYLDTASLTVAVEFLRTSFRAAVESGDVVLGCYSLEHMVTDMLARGDSLDQLWPELVKALDFAKKAKFMQVVNVLTSMQAFVQGLRGGTASPSGFAEEEINAALERGEGAPPVAICFDRILKLRGRFMAGRYEAAMAAAQEVEPLL